MTNQTNPIFAVSGAPDHVNPSTYGFVSSSDLIQLVQSKGWELTRTFVNRARRRHGYQKHLLTFEHPDYRNVQGLKDEHKGNLTLNVINSHDGTSALNIGIGFFRLICSNGLMAGTAFSKFRVIHSKRYTADIMDTLGQAMDNIPNVISQIKTLQDITLTPDQYRTIANDVASERLRTVSYNLTLKDMRLGIADLGSIIKPERKEDAGLDAFTFLNRVQEKLIRGGIMYEVLAKVNESGLTPYRHYAWKRTRALNSLNEATRLNRLVWDKVLEVSKAS